MEMNKFEFRPPTSIELKNFLYKEGVTQLCVKRIGVVDVVLCEKGEFHGLISVFVYVDKSRVASSKGLGRGSKNNPFEFMTSSSRIGNDDINVVGIILNPKGVVADAKRVRLEFNEEFVEEGSFDEGQRGIILSFGSNRIAESWSHGITFYASDGTIIFHEKRKFQS